MYLKKLNILLILFLLNSCCQNKNNTEEENTYQIVTLLVNGYKKYIVLSPSFPPPLLSKMKIQDSLLIYKYFIQQSLKKKTIALTNKMFAIKETHSFRDKCEIDKEIVEKLNTLTKSKSLNIEKVTLYGKDTLIQYKEEFKKSSWKGFYKMDLLLSFSRISFNKQFNKAIMIVGATKGHLNGFSTLVYLEKENYVWKIKCQKGLSIS